MMRDVSLETCWAIKKIFNNKFYYTVASCWLFLYDLYYDARIHEYQTNINVSYKEDGINRDKLNGY
jgi:hypothetical protein